MTSDGGLSAHIVNVWPRELAFRRRCRLMPLALSRSALNQKALRLTPRLCKSNHVCLCRSPLGNV